MWKVLLLFNLGVFQYTASASLPSPTGATISSVNLRNVLEWTPGKGTPGNATFTVQYTIYGDSVVDGERRRVRWRAVQRCTEVRQSWCDLSNETWDLEQGYYAKVRAVSRQASSKWVLTRRFDPKSDTSFGPPLVTVEVENKSAIITVKGPMRYQPNYQMPAVSMAMVYPQMTYNLSINNTNRGKTSHFVHFSSVYKHLLTDYDTEYCISAKAKFLTMPVQCQSSEWQCITTPPGISQLVCEDPALSQLKWVVVGIVVIMLCVCIIAATGYILYQYLMGAGQKTPHTLDVAFSNQPSVIIPPAKTHLNVITAIQPAGPGMDQDFEDPPPQYAIHALPEPAYGYGDLSISYGSVAAPSTTWGGQERKRGRVSGENLKSQQNHSSGVYLLQATCACSQRSFYTQQQIHTAAAAAAETSAPEQAALFHIPLNLKGEMLKEDGATAPGAEEKKEDELEPLLPVYAAQNSKFMSAANSKHSDLRLADDHGAMGLEATETGGGGHPEEEEQEPGTIFIDWDPKLGKLVLPELATWIYTGSEPGNGGEPTRGGEEEGGELLLADVFVRQASEEEVQAPRGPETEPGGGGEAQDLLTKWDLVIPMDD